MSFARDLDFGVEVSGDGSGTPLLLIHGAFTSRACQPLMRQPRLTSARPVIHYDRRGYGRTPAPPPRLSIADQVADARTVLDGLGLRRAHVLGHSIGTIIALQLALEAPDLVESLVLVDPTFVTRPERLDEFQAAMAEPFGAYAAGDRSRTVHHLYRVLDGETYRPMLDRSLGESWFDEAVSALDLYFRVELPAAVEWRLSEVDAARLQAPILAVLGGAGPDVFGNVFGDVLLLLPHARGEVIAGVTHNVIAGSPDGVAALVHEFFGNTPAAVREMAR